VNVDVSVVGCFWGIIHRYDALEDGFKLVCRVQVVDSRKGHVGGKR
jgi:hypothetical protein